MNLTAKNHPSTDTLEQVKKELSTPCGIAYFLIDGYLVCAAIHQIDMQLKLYVYVISWLKGAWLWHGKESELHSMPEISRRFYRLVKTGRSKQELQKWEKIFGKIKCRELGIYDKFCSTDCNFATADSFLKHIQKNNASIEVLSYEKYHLLVNAKAEEAA